MLLVFSLIVPVPWHFKQNQRTKRRGGECIVCPYVRAICVHGHALHLPYHDTAAACTYYSTIETLTVGVLSGYVNERLTGKEGAKGKRGCKKGRHVVTVDTVETPTIIALFKRGQSGYICAVL